MPHRLKARATLRNRRLPIGPGKSLALLAAFLVLALAAEAQAVLHLQRGMVAPEITLKDLDGNDVAIAQMQGKTLVVIFGEIFHDKTRQACWQVQQATQDRRLAGEHIVTLLIVTQPVRAEDPEAHAADQLPELVLRDPGRQAFGVYRVAVMPTVVVIDPQGKVVHAIPGLTARLSDLVTDSLLYSTGRLSEAQFEAALKALPAAADADQLRVERTALLARQLVRRGLDELATEKYLEVLELDPQHQSARVELGMLLLKHRRLRDAENQFRAVLAADSSDSQAALGLAFVHALRGGDELDEAQKTVSTVLARSPLEPRAHYLQGLIHEQRDRSEQAAASFKRAAQLLLERGQPEQEP